MQEQTNGVPSGLKEATEPLAYLLMSQKFAPRQRSLTSLDGFDKAIFFLEIACHNIQHDLIRVYAFLGCPL